MEAEIIIAVLSMFGTAFGSVIGVMTANKLSNYYVSLPSFPVVLSYNLITY